MNEDRLEDIETRIAFQEKIIKDLSDEVYEQQKQIKSLDEALKLLLDQLRESSPVLPGINLKDEKPPHY